MGAGGRIRLYPHSFLFAETRLALRQRTLDFFSAPVDDQPHFAFVADTGFLLSEKEATMKTVSSVFGSPLRREDISLVSLCPCGISPILIPFLIPSDTQNYTNE
jgi:hypothetical protein